MAVSILNDTGANFFRDGDSTTLDDAGTDRLLHFGGFAKHTGSFTTDQANQWGSTTIVDDRVGPITQVSSVFIAPIDGHILDANIPSGSQTLAYDWSLNLNTDFSGTVWLLAGVDQTTPVVAADEEFLNSAAPSDLTYSCAAGDMIIYEYYDNVSTSPAAPTVSEGSFTQKVTNPDTGDPQIDEGSIWYEISGNARTNATIRSSNGSVVGMHKVTVIKAASGDVTPPSLSSPTASSITSTGCTPQVTTDEDNGTAYMVVVPNGDVPSVAQIKAGQQSSGAAAIDSESKAVSATGVITFAPTTNGSPLTEYELYFVHTDAASNDSTASTVGFTTSAAPAGGFLTRNYWWGNY